MLKTQNLKWPLWPRTMWTKTCTFNLLNDRAYNATGPMHYHYKGGLSSNKQLKVIQNNILNVLDNKINVNL